MGRREWYFSMIEWKESKSNWYSLLFSLFQENQWIEVRNWYFWCACYEIQAVLGSLQRCTFKRWYSHNTSLAHSNSYFWTFCDCLSRYLLFYIVLEKLDCTTHFNPSKMFVPSLLTPVAGQIWLTTVQVFWLVLLMNYVCVW